MPRYHLLTAISDIFEDELSSEFHCNYPPIVCSLSPSLMLVLMLVNDMCNYVFVPIYAHTRVRVDMHMPWHRCEGQRSLLNLYFPIATLGLQMIVSDFDVEFVCVLWILTSVWMTDTLPPPSTGSFSFEVRQRKPVSDIRSFLPPPALMLLSAQCLSYFCLLINPTLAAYHFP